MERNFYHTDDFEDLIREKADQYKMYPSDRVWKGIERSVRSRRRWYWTGFITLLSAISYFAVNELMSPPAPASALSAAPEKEPLASPPITAQQLVPFSRDLSAGTGGETVKTPGTVLLSDLSVDESGDLSASFEFPLDYLGLPGLGEIAEEKASLRISGLKPLKEDEKYNIELSLISPETTGWLSPADRFPTARAWNQPSGTSVAKVENKPAVEEKSRSPRINWLQEQAGFRYAGLKTRRISWQLAFSPTVNYRKLTGGGNAKLGANSTNVPLALNIAGDINSLVNHKPALGFELGTHGLMALSNRLTLKGGIQFNYSKYDISAFRAPAEYATIALNSTTGVNPPPLLSYTDIRNFGGVAAEDLKNQYFQLSMPVGLEFKVLGNDRLQFNVASTIQPTYLLNRNTYLITTDYKNYTQEPSLVRRWNLNAGAEAFISYSSGGVKWQVGPQFRYQLLSSYENIYPIKEYLMEYGIKIGITKTIR